METILILVAVVVVFTIYKKLTAPKVTMVTKTELTGLLQDKKTKRSYIDVRTAEEFNQKKIKGFKNIPLQSLSMRTSEVDKSSPVVLICASGSRSMQAARILAKQGYGELINVRGGIGH
jgi:rhodanese-related sulfurtransferase